MDDAASVKFNIDLMNNSNKNVFLETDINFPTKTGKGPSEDLTEDKPDKTDEGKGAAGKELKQTMGGE